MTDKCYDLRETDMVVMWCISGGSTGIGRRDCMVPLLHVLGMHTKLLATHQYANLWSHITGVTLNDTDSSDK